MNSPVEKYKRSFIGGFLAKEKKYFNYMSSYEDGISIELKGSSRRGETQLLVYINFGILLISKYINFSPESLNFALQLYGEFRL